MSKREVRALLLVALKPSLPLAVAVNLVIVCLVIVIVVNLLMVVCCCVNEILYYYLVVVVQPIPFSLVIF